MASIVQWVSRRCLHQLQFCFFPLFFKIFHIRYFPPQRNQPKRKRARVGYTPPFLPSLSLISSLPLCQFPVDSANLSELFPPGIPFSHPPYPPPLFVMFFIIFLAFFLNLSKRQFMVYPTEGAVQDYLQSGLLGYIIFIMMRGSERAAQHQM